MTNLHHIPLQITENQHRFIRGWSFVIKVVGLTEFIAEPLDNLGQVDLINTCMPFKNLSNFRPTDWFISLL